MQQIPPAIRRRLEPLPFPMRFSDGRIRLATVRLALLQRLWGVIPGGALESRQALDAYQGGDVLDVGAFHGWYSVLLAPRARTGDRLVSFEPDPRAVPVLEAVLRDVRRRFGSVNTPVVTQPVGDGREVAASWPAGAASHPRFSEPDHGSSLPSLTVDAYVSDQQLQPRLVKVDVEGAELSVLRGMRRTLTEHRPVLLLEVHPDWQPTGIRADDIDAFMEQAGYQGTTFESGSISRRQIWAPRVGSYSAS